MHALHGGSAVAEDAGGARVLLVYPMWAQLHHLLVVATYRELWIWMHSSGSFFVNSITNLLDALRK